MLEDRSCLPQTISLHSLFGLRTNCITDYVALRSHHYSPNFPLAFARREEGVIEDIWEVRERKKGRVEWLCMQYESC